MQKKTQLKEYLDEEKALHPGEKIICMLANTSNDMVRVWKTEIDDEHLLSGENIMDSMEHYKGLFELNRENTFLLDILYIITNAL